MLLCVPIHFIHKSLSSKVDFSRQWPLMDYWNIETGHRLPPSLSHLTAPSSCSAPPRLLLGRLGGMSSSSLSSFRSMARKEPSPSLAHRSWQRQRRWLDLVAGSPDPEAGRLDPKAELLPLPSLLADLVGRGGQPGERRGGACSPTVAARRGDRSRPS